MGAIVNWVQRSVDNAMKNKLEEKGQKLQTVCKEVTKDIREEITQDWFSGFNSSSTEEATQYDVSSMNGKGKGKGSLSLTVEVNSYVSEDAWEPMSFTADQWAERHNHCINPKGFVLGKLIMAEGVIGLPSAGVVTGWVNDHYHESSTGMGLEAYTASAGNWASFEGRVKARL